MVKRITTMGDFDWKTFVSEETMKDMANGIFAVRISDNMLDPGDWPVGIIRIDSGVVITQHNVCGRSYELPNMEGWTLRRLYGWLWEMANELGPCTDHEIGLIEKWR